MIIKNKNKNKIRKIRKRKKRKRKEKENKRRVRHMCYINPRVQFTDEKKPILMF